MKALNLLKDYLTLILYGNIKYARKKGVKIGNECRIYTRSFGSEPFLITIGNRVTVTSGVRFITHDGSTWLMRDNKGRRYLYRPILIGDNVFIGVNSIIMPGIKICNNVIVAAGSVVTKSVPEGSVVGGVPAKIIANYKDLQEKILTNYLTESDVDKSLNYRDRIEKIVEYEYKEFMIFSK
jgi:acetyltransferase-like isoleucine patch superfamily enzyme